MRRTYPFSRIFLQPIVRIFGCLLNCKSLIIAQGPLHETLTGEDYLRLLVTEMKELQTLRNL